MASGERYRWSGSFPVVGAKREPGSAERGF